MDATVHISRHALDYFRKLARDCPYEVQAYLIGEVRGPQANQFYVTTLVHPREYFKQTVDEIQPTATEYTRAKTIAFNENRRIIGDLHSHPNWDAVMSPADHKACLEDGLQICGIVSVRDRKTKVRFWQVNSALPCDIKWWKPPQENA